MATSLYNPQVLEDGLRNAGFNLSRSQLDAINQASSEWLDRYDPRQTRLGASFQVIPYKILKFAGGSDSGPSLKDAFTQLLSGDFSGFFTTLKNWFSGSMSETDRAGTAESIQLALGNLNARLKTSPDPQIRSAADYITGNILGGVSRQSWSLYDQAMHNLQVSPETKTDLPVERRLPVTDTATIGEAPNFRVASTATLTSQPVRL